MEQTIFQQIVTAVEPKYLQALHTPGTNKLNHTLPQIFTHLFDTYGDVSPSELRDLTQRIEALSLPLSEPIDTIFSEIDNVASIAEIAGAPMTATQKINMACILFSKQHVYKSALQKWDNTSSTCAHGRLSGPRPHANHRLCHNYHPINVQ